MCRSASARLSIATATEFRHGLWDGEPGFTEKLAYPGFRDMTEYRKSYVSTSGAVVRTADPSVRLEEADRVKLAAIFTEVLSIKGRRALIVPSTRLNDIWLCDCRPGGGHLREPAASHPVAAALRSGRRGAEWTLSD